MPRELEAVSKGTKKRGTTGKGYGSEKKRGRRDGKISDLKKEQGPNRAPPHCTAVLSLVVTVGESP